MKKKLKKVELGSIDIDPYIEYDVLAFILKIKDLCKGHQYCKLRMSYGRDELFFTGQRMETDEEFEKRKLRSERAKLGAKRRGMNQKQKELAELKRLAEKHGKKVT